MSEQNPRYDEAVTALNYSVTYLNLQTKYLINTVGEDVAQNMMGLTGTAKV